MFCKKPLLAIIIFLLAFQWTATAQKTLKYEDYNSEFKKGLELFNKEKYGAAQHYFQMISDNYFNYSTEIKAEADYLIAICAIELFNKDAEYLISGFITDYPESPRIKTAFYQMGIFQYRKKKYIKAVEYLEKIDPYNLSNQEMAEYFFKLGYSYFMLNDVEKASKSFFEIKDADTKYTVPALYYYSHISYQNKNYENALVGFERLSKNETFAPIVPYYITQIYYFQQRYDKIIAYAPPLLDSATAKRKSELARIIGDAYYKTNDYKKCIPYLELYKDKSNSFSSDDAYALGYAYYKNGNFDKAASMFKEVSKNANPLSQNAMYHLADCYLKMNDKANARIAFSNAAKLNEDSEITETSLFNYAKLTYELSFSPFNEAINAFQKYINTYPESEKLDEVYTYLAKAFMTTKNYKDAIESLENIQKITDEIEASYQRVTFFRGLELFNDLKLQDAVICFDKSLNNAKYNASYKALSLYWKGEAYYRLRRYSEALENFNQFILSPGSIISDEFNSAHYNIGYCHFKLKDYKNAITWFRKYVDTQKSAPNKLLSDAYVRIADCYFISKDYTNAIDYYDNVIKTNITDVDYSLFQKGFANGLLKNYKEKNLALNTLIKEYPNSAFCDDGLYELGRSYTMINENDSAIASYQKLIDIHTQSSYINKALLQIGLVYYNIDRDEDALRIYKHLAEKSPDSKEAKDALFGIKNIYIDRNDAESYIAYTKELGDFASVSYSEQDSLTYFAAENIYMQGKFIDALPKMRQYIEKFPTGNFILNAHYYKADCNFRNKEYIDAIESYTYVTNKPKSKFTEFALLNSARINYETGDYEQSLKLYSELEKIAEIKTNISEALFGKNEISVLCK
jgi:TolA-binding protein